MNSIKEAFALASKRRAIEIDTFILNLFEMFPDLKFDEVMLVQQTKESARGIEITTFITRREP